MAHSMMNISNFKKVLQYLWKEQLFPNMYICSALESHVYDENTLFFKEIYGDNIWTMIYNLHLTETYHESEVIESLKSFCETKTFPSVEKNQPLKIIRIRLYEHELSHSLAFFIKEIIDQFPNIRICIISMRMSNLHDEIQSSFIAFMIHSTTKHVRKKLSSQPSLYETLTHELSQNIHENSLDCRHKDSLLAQMIIQHKNREKCNMHSARSIIYGLK